MRAEEAPPETAAPAGAESVADAAKAEEGRSIRDGVFYCLIVFLAVRVGLFVLGFLATGLLPDATRIAGATELSIPGPVGVPGWAAHAFTPGWHNLFTAWERFDALWFLRIAAAGYRGGDGSAAFFPLYPLATRIVSFVIGGHPYAASIIVSNASFLGALCVLFFLTRSELSEDAARKTVLYLSLFPTSFFFFAPYSESLFLLLAVTSFWAARRNRWALAGIMAALAALTRNVGLIMVPALAVEAVHQWREGRGSLAPRLAGAAVGALGTLLYMGYWVARTGDWLAPINQQANWQRVAVWPWSPLVQGTKLAFRYPGQYPGAYWLVDWLIVVPILVAAGYAVVRFRRCYGVYVALGLLAPLSFVFPGRPLMSLPRFALPLFPIFWAFAVAVQRRRVPHAAVVSVGAAGLGLLTVLYVNWYYIF